MASQGGKLQLNSTTRKVIEKAVAPYIELDRQLYAYANDLLDAQLLLVKARGALPYAIKGWLPFNETFLSAAFNAPTGDDM